MASVTEDMHPFVFEPPLDAELALHEVQVPALEGHYLARPQLRFPAEQHGKVRARIDALGSLDDQCHQDITNGTQRRRGGVTIRRSPFTAFSISTVCQPMAASRVCVT